MKAIPLALGIGMFLALPALATENPCAPKTNPCQPAAMNSGNPCAPKMNTGNPCAPKHPMAVAPVDAQTVDPGKIKYSELRALNDRDFGTVTGRGMKGGQTLMGGMPVTGHHVVLEGEVVDLTCYQSSGLTGGKHALCARVCALKGGPVGLLTKGGKVYQILPEKAGMPVADDVLDAIATKVRVEGNVNSRGGLNTLAITKLQEQ